MKLNTKKLFPLSKKPKYTSNKKVKFSPSILTTKEKSNQSSSDKNGNPNQNSSSKNGNQKGNINPFNDNFVQTSGQKNITHKKTKSSKTQKFQLEFLKVKENNNPYSNNLMLTTESDSKQNDEYDIEKLIKIFKNSKLKSTVIMDNNGNNNLNSEQKKFIKDYFDKKEMLENNLKKCSINSIKVDNYNNNNILLKKKTEKHDKAINLKFKKFDLDQVRNNLFYSDTEGRILSDKPFLSTKQNNKLKGLLENNEIIEDEDCEYNQKNGDDKENNSMFENCTNKSFDSSFLGSSIDGDFLQNITDSVTKN